MHIENRIYFCHIMLSTILRKIRIQHNHFAISTNFLSKEQSTKAKLKDGSRSSNWAIQTLQMKKEEVDYQISALLAAVEEDESLTTRMLPEDFNVDHRPSS